MAGNVIEVTIRARDEAAKTLADLESKLRQLQATSGGTNSALGGLGNALSSGNFKSGSDAINSLSRSASQLGRNLASGNFLGAASDLGALTNAVGDTAEAFSGVSKSTIIAGAAIATVAVVAGLATKAVLDFAEAGGRYADSLGDVAEITGLTTEQISALKYAAEQSDTSIESVTQSIRFLARNLYEARTAGSEANKSFQEIGFSAKELAQGGVTAEQALLRMADAVKSAPSQLDRIAIATKFVGRGAAEMVPFLQQGSEGIKGLTKEAAAMGQVVTSSAAAVGDKYTKAILALQGAMNGLKAQVAEGVLPALTNLLNFTTHIVASSGNVVTGVNKMGEAMGILSGIRFDDVQASFDKFVKSVEKDPALDALLKLVAVLKAVKLASDFGDLEQENPTLATDFAGSIGRQPKPAPQILQGPGTFDNQDTVTQTAQQAMVEFLEKTQAESKKAAEEIAKLRAEFAATAKASFSVPESIIATLGRIGVGLKDQIEFIKNAQKALNSLPAPGLIRQKDADGNDISATKGAEQLFSKEIGKAADSIDTTALDEIPLKLDDAGEHALKLSGVFESIGVNVEDLLDRLTAVGESLDGIGAIGEAVGGTLKDAFAFAFDPLRVAIDGTQQAVAEFASTASQALGDLFDDVFVKGRASFVTLRQAVEGAITAVTRLAASIAKAIIQALILKALGFASGGGVTGDLFGGGGNFAAKGGTIAPGFSQGGGISRVLQTIVQPIQHFVSGGSVTSNSTSSSLSQTWGGNISHFVRGGAVAAMAGLALGGAIPRMAQAAPMIRLNQGGAISSAASWSNTFNSSNSFSNVVHAANGLRLVPGFPQSYDSVPAMLAPGEVVLPNVGGRSPSDLLGNLGNLSRDLSVVIARSQGPSGQMAAASSPMIGEVHIHANDADSVRHSVRPGGEFERQLARSSELGR